MSDWTPTVVMACACGGFLVADHANHRDVLYEVMRHNSTERHAAWRVKREKPEQGVGLEGPVRIRGVP